GAGGWGSASWRNLSGAGLGANQRSPSMTLMAPLSIVVMGAGGVGGYFGARLALAGAAVRFVARGAHLATIRRDGLRVRSMTDGERVVKIDAVETLDGGAAADAVLCCVKSYGTDSPA